MDMKKLKHEEKADPTNHFDRLPEELLLSILIKTDDDLKFLCQCSLVSKRFALTIYCVQTVSLSLPNFESHLSRLRLSTDVFQFFIEFPSFNNEEITQFTQSLPNQTFKFIIFLQNFKELKSIYLEFICPTRSFLKWKAKCRKSKPMIESFVFVLPALTYKKTDHGFQGEQEDQEFPSNFSQLSSLMSCIEWVSIAYLLIKCHHSLESVTITNSEKEGKLVVRDEQIVEWRKSFLSVEFFNLFKTTDMRIACLPELHLPLSGYIMKMVCFAIMEFQSESGDVADKDDAVSWGYDADEKVLGEAVREILTKHGDSIHGKM